MKKYKRFRHFLAAAVFRALICLGRRLPRKLLFLLSVPAGMCGSRLFPRERMRSERNLHRIFPDMPQGKIRKTAQRVFIQMIISFFDAVKLPELRRDKFLSKIICDTDAVFSAYAKGKGVIVLSGHLSCFELQTQIAQRAGIQSITVGAEIFDRDITDRLTRLRQRNGVEYIPRNGALQKIIRRLRKGKVFGVLIDQDTTKEGVFADFLGIPAFTPTMPIKLALKYDIPLVFSVIFRDSRGIYHFHTRKCPDFSAQDREKQILSIAQAFNSFYGEYILHYPEQWVWIHRRWKRIPEDHPHIPVISSREEL
ncbi:MAG: lysophospholipid acyltransferase family protein [Fibrobacterota bacterium]